MATNQAFNSITQGVLIGDANGMISFVNAAFESITGYTKAEIMGKTCKFLQGKATDEATVEAIRQTLERGIDFSGEIINYRKDGSTFWNDLRISPVINARGQVEQFIGITRDITAHKQMEEKLGLDASVFTHLREGVIITDAAGLIVDVNDAFTRITAYPREEAIGQSPRLLHSDRQDPCVYTALWQDLQEKGHWAGELWGRRKCGEVYPESLKISTVRDQQGRVKHYVGVFSDISERKALEDKLRQLSFYDSLTGLPNRRLLEDRLRQAMLVSKRCNQYGALMFLDLDNFKKVNDLHGHDVGDLLLIEVARRLSTCVREVDTVARLGGDEFVVLLHQLDTDKALASGYALGVAEKIRGIVALPHQLTVEREGHGSITLENHGGASIGVVMFGNHAASQTDIMKWADAAMYLAKSAGRNRVQFHEPC